MDIITINGKEFVPYLKREDILQEVKKIAALIDRDLSGKNPLVICVLNGAIIFAADLIRNISINCELASLRIKSYSGTKSSGKVETLCGLSKESVSGRSLLIVEDIVDTGLSMQHITEELRKLKPLEIKVAALLSKPEARKCDVHIDYTGFSIPDKFVVGYGLDYDEKGRNLNDIYVINE